MATVASETHTAAADRVELSLEGMTCAACAVRIERVLNRLPGTHATVNFATETAVAEVDRGTVDPAQLIAAVERAGYHAQVRADPQRAREQDRVRRAEALATLRRDLMVAIVLTAPLLVPMLPMVVSLFGFDAGHDELVPRWAQLVLATPVQFWVGRRFYVGAFHALRGGAANMDVLVVLGTTIAWL